MAHQVAHEVSFEELLDYVENRLDPVVAQRVSAHLATGCSRCAQDVAWLRRVLAVMAADALVDAPRPTVARAQGLYRQRRRRVTRSLPNLWAGLRGGPAVRAAAAVALAALLILSVSWAWGNTMVAQAATLAEVEGPVEVRLPGADEWQVAAPGMALAAGSVLRSGPGAAATLVYPDGSRTCLSAGAELQIIGLSGRRNGRATSIRLAQIAGRTQHELASSLTSLDVEAAGAVAQARAARYEVWVDESAIEVYAERGQVTVSMGDSTAQLGAGDHGWVTGGQVVVATATPMPTGEPTGEPAPGGRVSPTAASVTPPATAQLPTRGPRLTHTPPGQIWRHTPPPLRTPFPGQGRAPTTSATARGGGRPTETMEPTGEATPTPTREPEDEATETPGDKATRTPRPSRTPEPERTRPPKPTEAPRATPTRRFEAPPTAPPPTPTSTPAPALVWPRLPWNRTPAPTRTGD